MTKIETLVNFSPLFLALQKCKKKRMKKREIPSVTFRNFFILCSVAPTSRFLSALVCQTERKKERVKRNRILSAPTFGIFLFCLLFKKIKTFWSYSTIPVGIYFTLFFATFSLYKQEVSLCRINLLFYLTFPITSPCPETRSKVLGRHQKFDEL